MDEARSKFNVVKEHTVRFRTVDGDPISISIVGAANSDQAIELAKQYARELYGERGASELTFVRVMSPDDAVVYVPGVTESATP